MMACLQELTGGENKMNRPVSRARLGALILFSRDPQRPASLSGGRKAVRDGLGADPPTGQILGNPER